MQAIALLLLCASLLACDHPKIVAPENWEVGERAQIGLSGFPVGSCVQFSSSDSTIVAVDGAGVAEARGSGTVHIRAIRIRCPNTHESFTPSGDTITVILRPTSTWRRA